MSVADKTVISQYSNSPTIRQMILAFAQAMDLQTAFYGGEDPQGGYVDPGYWDDDYAQVSTPILGMLQYVWDLTTAQGFGLDIWGRILNVSRAIPLTSTGEYFGFSEGDGDFQPFGQAPFYGGAAASSTYILQDPAYRVLLFVKAMANISGTNSASLNQLLKVLFAGRGRCYVNDLGGMQMRYTFEFPLQPFELAILTSAGIMPRPGGVELFVLQAYPATTFGFAEAGGQPFGQGTFFDSGDLYAA